MCMHLSAGSELILLPRPGHQEKLVRASKICAAGKLLLVHRCRYNMLENYEYGHDESDYTPSLFN